MLPLEERDQHDRGADVGDDEDQLQERAEVDPVVGTASGDVALRVVQNGLVQQGRGDRGDEGEQVQRAEDLRDLRCELIWTPLVSRRSRGACAYRGADGSFV